MGSFATLHGCISRRSYGCHGAALCRLAVWPPRPNLRVLHFNGPLAVSGVVIVAKKVIKASTIR
jgi:hypothetical protein